MEEIEYFKTAAQRDLEERSERVMDISRVISFGIPFMDTVLGGILPTDLVLIGAATGKGKTELATTCALNACMNLKKVHFFALEAETNEIERRMKYKVIAEKYRKDGGKEYINYQDWRLGRLDFLVDYENYASDVVGRLDNLFTFYRDTDFDIEMFAKIFSTLKGKSQLVIVDHLQYFDFDVENENAAIYRIMKRMKDLTQLHRIPIILNAHMRKATQAAKEKPLIPSADDFMGTGHITKIATRSIIMAPGGMISEDESVCYFRAVKNRLDGARLEVIGKAIYNSTRNMFIDEKIKFGKLVNNDKAFQAFDHGFEPQWVVNKWRK
jgi:replicative DNA helicase